MTEDSNKLSGLLSDCCFVMSKRFLEVAQTFENRGDTERADRLRREALTQWEAFQRHHCQTNRSRDQTNQ